MNSDKLSDTVKILFMKDGLNFFDIDSSPGHMAGQFGRLSWYLQNIMIDKVIFI